jgi:hypothetical protein
VQVTLIYRHDYKAHPRQKKPLQRKISNEEEVTAVASSIVGADNVRTLSFESMTMNQQLEAILSADIIVAVHGAALSYTLFLRPGSRLIELMPHKYNTRQHFKAFARYMDIDYSQLRIRAGQYQHEVPVDNFKTMLQENVNAWHAGAADKRKQQAESNPLRELQLLLPEMADREEKEEVKVVKEVEEEKEVKSAKQITKKEKESASEHKDAPTLKVTKVKVKKKPISYRRLEEGEHRLAVIVPFRDSDQLNSQGGNRTANLREVGNDFVLFYFVLNFLC